MGTKSWPHLRFFRPWSVTLAIALFGTSQGNTEAGDSLATTFASPVEAHAIEPARAQSGEDAAAAPALSIREQVNHLVHTGSWRSAEISGFPASIPGDVFRNAEMLLFDKLSARWPAGTPAPVHLREPLAAYRSFYYERSRYGSPEERAFGWLQEEMFHVSLLALPLDLPERQYFQAQLDNVRHTAFRHLAPISFEPVRIVGMTGEVSGLTYELPYFARWELDSGRKPFWPQDSNPLGPLRDEPNSMLQLPGTAQADLQALK